MIQEASHWLSSVSSSGFKEAAIQSASFELFQRRCNVVPKEPQVRLTDRYNSGRKRLRHAEDERQRAARAALDEYWLILVNIGDSSGTELTGLVRSFDLEAKCLTLIKLALSRGARHGRREKGEIDESPPF